MFRIMYKTQNMRRFVSAVVPNDAGDKMVEARFYTENDALNAAQSWFSPYGAEFKIEKVKE